ncbi:MAG: cupin domain-containing protein [Terriglobales bacterium]
METKGNGWDEVIEESFPASDPPGNTTHAGPPDGGAAAKEPEAAPGRMRETLEPTEGAALHFDLAREMEQLEHEHPWQAGRNAKTIVKFGDFRIVLIVMHRESRLPGHHADGRVSVHALSGHIRLQVSGETFDLKAGQILVLDRGVRHDVEALEDSAFLLTSAWPGAGAHVERAER